MGGGPPDPGKESLLASSSHPASHRPGPEEAVAGGGASPGLCLPPAVLLCILPAARRWQETGVPGRKEVPAALPTAAPPTVTQRGSNRPKDAHTGQSRLNRATSGRPLARVAFRAGADQTRGPLQPTIGPHCAQTWRPLAAPSPCPHTGEPAQSERTHTGRQRSPERADGLSS